MSIVAERVSRVRLGDAQKYRNLTLFPLLAEGPAQPAYRLLDEALAAGCARVTEVSESGHVPELKFVNGCDRPVLLLDGEELVGAKQNRILNLSVLAPAGRTIVIPVSCVEAGRWRADSAEFASAKRAHYAAGRASKAAQVSAALRATGAAESDQAAVWFDISAKAERMHAASPTAAAAALYEQHRASLDDYLQAFSPVAGQCGAVFGVNGRVQGLDLFDSPATLPAVLAKLVESYALDAIDGLAAANDNAEIEAPAGFLEETAQAKVELFPAVGEGEDLRLTGERLAGGALVDGGSVIHLCAFRVPEAAGLAAERRTSMARASSRRRARGGGGVIS